MSTPPSTPEPSYGPADPWAPAGTGGLPTYPGAAGTPETGGENRQVWAHQAAISGHPAPPGGRPRPSRGGAWRIVLGVVIVLSILSSLTNPTASASEGDSTAMLVEVVLRFLFLGLAVWLIVSGSRRNAEKRRLRRSV